MILNIYPQEFPHDEAAILLDLEAAQALADRLFEAIATGKCNIPIEVFDSDGEGYELAISINDSFEGCTPSYLSRGDTDDDD